MAHKEKEKKLTEFNTRLETNRITVELDLDAYGFEQVETFGIHSTEAMSQWDFEDAPDLSSFPVLQEHFRPDLAFFDRVPALTA